MQFAELGIGNWFDFRQLVGEMSGLSHSAAVNVGLFVWVVYLVYVLFSIVVPILKERAVWKERIDGFNHKLQRLEEELKILRKKDASLMRSIKTKRERIRSIDRAKENYGFLDKVRKSGEDKILKEELKLKISELMSEKKDNREYIQDVKRRQEQAKRDKKEAELNYRDMWKDVLRKEMKKARFLCLTGVFIVCVIFCGDDIVVSTIDTWNEVALGGKEPSALTEIERTEADEETEPDDGETGEETQPERELTSERTLRENNYTFILEESHLHKSLSEKEKNMLFAGDPAELYTKPVGDYFAVSETELTTEDNVLDVEKMNMDEQLTAIADELEKPFLSQIEEAKDCLYQDEWLRKAPSSMQLEKLMNTRKKVITQETGKPYRRTIYFRLANDCQRLADECLAQNQDEETILYYYGMSIAYCCCAMNCEMEENTALTDEFITNYLNARYRDIETEKLYETDKT
ncbi:MAG: hypothetical protein Q4C58_00755 [Eubacteriales bacterium]|nr:hypothetical protein [Eubacteriales bacterium]